MSEEELKIRCELEKDVERGLEEEIKDGIYHLALRLQRLYHHQLERINPNISRRSLLKILISMEGGKKIEIKEIKKVINPKPEKHNVVDRPEPNNYRINQPRKVKFDWTRTLRSGPNTINHFDEKNKKNTKGKSDGFASLEQGWKC